MTNQEREMLKIYALLDELTTNPEFRVKAEESKLYIREHFLADFEKRIKESGLGLLPVLRSIEKEKGERRIGLFTQIQMSRKFVRDLENEFRESLRNHRSIE